jgi:hypothetical protein
MYLQYQLLSQNNQPSVTEYMISNSATFPARAGLKKDKLKHIIAQVISSLKTHESRKVSKQNSEGVRVTKESSMCCKTPIVFR